ncbi:MAG: thioredoxin [Hyphomonadaceae bacterium]|nr:thioredoxin [Hyphomonadaceae bacterium]MBC6412355.1 thioredoxin [Hyphomonadaceae bacterium]
MATVKVTDNSFQADVIESSIPVLVDFWAEWCGPCKQLARVLEAVSEEFVGQVKIAKVNVTNDPETPGKFHVRGVPTMMIFKEGEVVATRVGAMTQAKIAEWISEHTGDAAAAA